MLSGARPWESSGAALPARRVQFNACKTGATAGALASIKNADVHLTSNK